MVTSHVVLFSHASVEGYLARLLTGAQAAKHRGSLDRMDLRYTFPRIH